MLKPPQTEPGGFRFQFKSLTTMNVPVNILFFPFFASAAAATTMPASDHRVDWSGRVASSAAGSAAAGSVAFDWLGVTARVVVVNATYVRLNATATVTRGTRLRAYAEDQGFLLYPTVQFWVERDPAFAVKTLWTSNRRKTQAFAVTVENIVDPQYGTGLTSVNTFITDGAFVAVPDAKRLGGAGASRSIEFVGDSITAATNVVRPPGAPSCGDAGYQSDASQTYAGLLCHHFGASCSTVAVGGKCVMRECGGLQMPDYYRSQFYGDGGKPTFGFAAQAGQRPPSAIFIDLGTNDMRAINKLGPVAGPAGFIRQTVEFMVNATAYWGGKVRSAGGSGTSRDNADPAAAAAAQPADGIQFFLNAGPMENTTMPWTLQAIEQAKNRGLKATFVNMTTACTAARDHGGNSDFCDGCAGHPGIEGHRHMFEAAVPVMAEVMGWD